MERRWLLLALVVAAGGPSAAGATAVAAPPGIGDVRVTSVSDNSATVSASINPNGLDTSYAGQYGPGGYGTEIPPVDVGAGDSAVTITVHLAGLKPGSTYEVLLSANNQAGTTNAPMVTLHTTGSPPAGTAAAPTTPRAAPAKATAGRFVRVLVGGTSSGGLAGVSCAGTALCVAVGSIGAPPSVRPLVERWGGDGWHKLDASAAGPSLLSGVFCPSRALCIAVGSTGSLAPLALRWAAGGWHRELPPEPPVSGAAGLNAVTCAAGDDCWAVGYIRGGTPEVTGLIEHWNGRTWTLAQLLLHSFLAGVGCSARNDCWAVGNEHDLDFAEHWNGRDWASVTTPHAHGTLSAVACPSRSSCWAGGDGARPLLRLAHGNWHGVPLPLGTEIASVSCASVEDCWASGYRTPSGSRLWAFASHWNGSRWTAARTASAGRLSALSGIACPGRSLCLAVGVGGDNEGKPLAERLRG